MGSDDTPAHKFFFFFSFKVTSLIIRGSEVFLLNNFSKHKQKMYIYHCCMLYLTDPGAPGTFQTWRPQKSLISPSSGELSPLQCCALSAVVRCRCPFHKLLIAVSDTGKQWLFLSRQALRPGCLAERDARQDVWKRVVLTERNARPRHTVLTPSPKPWAQEVKETVGIADSQKLGCNRLSYLEKNAKKKTPSYTPPMVSLCRVSAARRGELRTVRAGEKAAAVLRWLNSDQCFTRRVGL